MRPAEPGPAPRPGEVRLVVYRPKAGHAARAYPVYDGEALIGLSVPGARFEYRCSPGARRFHLLGPGDPVVHAELAGEKTYFLKVSERPGCFRLDLVLEGLGPEAALPEAEEGDLVELDPAAAADLGRRLGGRAAESDARYASNPGLGRRLHSHQGR
jgi:hypothetical protein